MKIRIFTAFLSIFTVCKSISQTFTSTTEVFIPDNTLVYSNLNITGLPNKIDSTNFGLISICVDVLHGYVGQLDLLLKSPAGREIKLTNNRGSNGQNFNNTCFAENGTLPVQSGVAPFLGTFIPDESINLLNNGQNPNGIWSFGVRDEIPYNVGRIRGFKLTFGNNPPATPAITICSIFNGAACKCPDGSNDCDLLPDMTNSSRVLSSQYYDEPALLHIGVGTPNIGYGPLEVRGVGECYCDTVRVLDPYVPCPDGSYPTEKVFQRIYHKSGSSITYNDRTAGYMQFHPAHGHIHLDNWSYNTVRIKGPQQDALKWPIVGRDSKVSFCLVNNFNCSSNLGYCADADGNPINHSQVGNPGLGIITGCGREQGIFPGYLDIYFPGYDGQELHMDSTICNGVYYAVSLTDPKNIVKESNENNNLGVGKVILGFQRDGDCCQTGFFADTTFGEAPLTVNFIDTTKPGSLKWEWDFGDGLTDTTQFPQHVYTKAGNYKVTLKTTAEITGCKNSATKNAYIKVRMSAANANDINVNIYPNPFKTYFNIYYNLKTNGDVALKLFDVSGKNIYETTFTKQTTGVHEQLINLPQLKAGVYIAKVMIGGVEKHFRLVKADN